MSSKFRFPVNQAVRQSAALLLYIMLLGWVALLATGTYAVDGPAAAEQALENNTVWAQTPAGSSLMVRSVITVDLAVLTDVDAIHLVTLRGADKGDPLIDLRWERDTAGFGLGWKLTLHQAGADAVANRTSSVSTAQTMGNPIPAPGHTYETLFSYHWPTGDVSFVITDITDGRAVRQGAGRGQAQLDTSWYGAGFSPRPAAVQRLTGNAAAIHIDAIPHYVPLDLAWQVAMAGEGGRLLPVWRFDPGDDVVVKVDVPATPFAGSLQLVYANDEGERPVATVPTDHGTQLIKLAATDLPIGVGRLQLQYVTEGQVIYAQDNDISVGTLTVALNPAEMTVADGHLLGTASFTSTVDLQRMPVTLEANISATVWDDTAAVYRSTPYASIVALSQFVDIPAGQTVHVPFEAPLAATPGNWEVKFNAGASMISTAMHLQAHRRFFSTRTIGTDRTADTTLRLCTYNMLGFQGWPEHIAAKELGHGYDKRLQHFVSVLDEMNCDILGIQEGSSPNWLQLFADANEVERAVSSTPTGFPGAIFSRHPIKRQWDIAAGMGIGNEVPFSRTIGAALIEIGGELLGVVNLHANPHHEHLRQIEAAILDSEIDRLFEYTPYIVVMGDFNSQVGAVIHNTLANRGFRNTMELAGGGIASTVTNLEGQGVMAIDHIYVSEALLGKVRFSRVISDAGFRLAPTREPDDWVHSDHLPVMAEIDW